MEFKQVKEYYGRILKGNKDLQTSACCCDDEIPARIKAILSEINDEILEKFYGCGSPLPPLLEGCTVLDLGCGTGRDAFLASRLVGPTGYVIGVDMTSEQLAVARRNLDSQMVRFGYEKANVDFRQGYIEDLRAIEVADNSVDVVISNCVLNLSPDKEAVFSEIFRVLKPGGELFFADIFSGCRIPAALYDDPVLRGECLSGAMYREDFRRLLLNLGCRDFRCLNSRRVELDNQEIAAKIGMAAFFSETIRAFKLADLEDICEDYGQTAVYKGSIPEAPHFFDLDDHHHFIAHKPMLVCGNTAAMLSETRLAPHFMVSGDRSRHFGPFDCGEAAEKAKSGASYGGACCC
ncbi:SAM-dependent methyltransferase SCO3452 (UbiE paralog) [hydrothermal vent metagenome]|uniref:Arsenite methyltransferase n=1 Tax=hydrothermal vent metagenome TaxID=652676 RepID=A0A3B0VTT9_9ZZZZ